MDFTYTRKWVGGSGTAYTTAANWVDAADEPAALAPGADDDVYIPAAAAAGVTNTVVATAPISVKSLHIGAADGSSLGGAVFEAQMRGTNTVSGNLVVYSGGSLTHGANTTATGSTADSALMKLNFYVGGNLTIASGGKATAKGKGYANAKGITPPANSFGGFHGGQSGVPTANQHCYGSIRRPVTLGSGGGYNGSLGGGAIYFEVVGSGTVNGEINADSADNSYYTGGGGSVFIIAASISGSGSGTIHANAGVAQGLGYNGATSGGGGRVAIHLTGATSDFSSFPGVISAYGGWVSANNNRPGSCGTVFLKTGSQAETQGTLRIDNGGYLPLWTAGKANQYTEIAAGASGQAMDVTDTEVGSVVMATNTRVRIAGTATLTVNGSWTNSSTSFLQDAGTKVVLSGSSDAEIVGKTTFADLSCTVPGKTLKFATGAVNGVTIAAHGSLTLCGDPDNLLILCGTEDAAWNIAIDVTTAVDCRYVNVSNSDASGGMSITAIGSVGEEANNVNWFFVDPIVPGEENSWLGVSTDWNEIPNWSRGRLPVDTDSVVIPGGKSFYPVLTFGETALNSLVIADGATLTLSGGNLLATNSLSVAGTLEATGFETITCRNAVDFTDGVFIAGNSIFLLSGGLAQVVNPAGCAFRTVKVAKSGGSVAWNHGFSAVSFQCEPTAALSMNFAAGELVTTRDFYLLGNVASVPSLTIGSAVPGTAWRLALSGAQIVNGTSVSDSDASAGATIFPDSTCTAVGSNLANWTFGGDIRTWVGGTDSENFRNPANWSPAQIPGASTRVVLLKSGSGTMTVNVPAGDAVSVGSLVCMAPGGALNVTSKAKLNVLGDMVVDEGATVALDYCTVGDANEVSGTLAVNTGGTLTHSAYASTETNKLYLHVIGNATVETGGAIDVVGKGYAKGVGPGAGGTQTAPSHGGRGAAYTSTDKTAPCYGSIIEPVHLGSGGHSSAGSAGGGAVRLAVDGTLTVNGTINASGGFTSQYYSGSGGSLWIVCGTLSGSGTVSANGGTCGSALNLGGGGGRIAIYETTADDFTAWSGAVAAYGGWYENNGASSPGGFAGTVYLKPRSGAGSVIINNNGGHRTISGQQTVLGSDYPTEDSASAMRKLRLSVLNGGHLSVLSNAAVGDVALGNGGYLTVTNVVLSIMSKVHKDRLGWTGTVQDSDGEIIWLGESGTVILVR